VLLVEDLATDGGSKVSFCDGLRQAGERCDHAFVFFFYDIFPKARETMAALGVDLHFLVTWRDILVAARRGAYFAPSVLDRVEAFLDHPLEWSAAHGGIADLASKP
jgi:orotate phosphoribosyltransferase